jgi:hypothetical protein
MARNQQIKIPPTYTTISKGIGTWVAFARREQLAYTQRKNNSNEIICTESAKIARDTKITRK